MEEQSYSPSTDFDKITQIERKYSEIKQRLSDNKSYGELLRYLELAELKKYDLVRTGSQEERVLGKYSSEEPTLFLDDDIIFHQAGHDMGNILQTAYVCGTFFLKEKNLPNASGLDSDLGSVLSFENVYQNLSGTNFPTKLRKKFMKDYARQIMLPSISNLIGSELSSNIPIFHHAMLEARSAYSEFLGEEPNKYAEEFDLRDAVQEFVETESFKDKNTFKPVQTVIDEESINPKVYFDKGSLYRMLRNLLRDAVTHSDSKVLKPTIKIFDPEDEESVNLQVFSEGKLDRETLSKIGRVPYTTQEDEKIGKPAHGYGKVGARRILERFWESVGKKKDEIVNLMSHHWRNTNFKGTPSVCWSAPIPLAE